MPPQSAISPLGAFIKALHDESIPCILIGAMVVIARKRQLAKRDRKESRRDVRQ